MPQNILVITIHAVDGKRVTDLHLHHTFRIIISIAPEEMHTYSIYIQNSLGIGGYLAVPEFPLWL